jgi:hypothetical protein
MMRPMLRILFYAIVALLMLAELFLSNIGSLLNLEATAIMVGLTPDNERARLLTLMVFDALAGIGAILVLWVLFGRRAAVFGRTGAWMVVAGMLLYGIYQIYSALFVLAPEWQPSILGVGLTYTLVGIAAWRIGRPLITPNV